MFIGQSHIQIGNEAYRVILGLFFLFCGCCIYLLFRSETINIYQWCSEVGLLLLIEPIRDIVDGWPVPIFVKYCLPDGLYCAAYILIVDAIWYRQKGTLKYIMLSIIPLVAIVIELLQYYGIAKGTFDVYDLICYMIPVSLYVFTEIKRNLITKTQKI